MWNCCMVLYVCVCVSLDILYTIRNVRACIAASHLHYCKEHGRVENASELSQWICIRIRSLSNQAEIPVKCMSFFQFFKRALWKRLYSAKETYNFSCQMHVVIHSYVCCDTFKYVKRYIRICDLNVYVFVTSLCMLARARAQKTEILCAKINK